MRVTDTPGFLLISGCLWVTGVVTMRSRPSAALALLVFGAIVAALYGEPFVTTTLVNGLAWTILLVVVVVQLLIATSATQREVAKSIALASGCIAASVPIGSLLNRPITLLLSAVALWLTLSTLPVVLRTPQHRPKARQPRQSDSLIDAFDELKNLPDGDIETLANDMIKSLAQNPNKQSSIEDIALDLRKPWAHIWVIAALLEQNGNLRFDSANRSKNARAQTMVSQDEAQGRNHIDKLPPVSIIFGNQINNEGSVLMTGDTYNIQNSVSGAIGRNIVRDISVTNRDVRTATPTDLSGEMRRLSKYVKESDSDELVELANEIDDAKDKGALRTTVQRVAGIAHALGPIGADLLKLATIVLEQVKS